MTPFADEHVRASLHTRILEIDGVLHAAIEPQSGVIWIVLGHDTETGPVELSVRNLLASLGHDPGQAEIRIAVLGGGAPRRRVRFVDTARREDADGVTVSVTLEWNDVTHTGSASGERGWAVELKTTAQAALAALETVSGQSLGLRIIGVKQIHAFDSTLMVVSILRTEGLQQRLVGAVIVGDDPVQSAALAVLSGLNRTLGNFLHTSD
jgi:hypothetical protein